MGPTSAGHQVSNCWYCLAHCSIIINQKAGYNHLYGYIFCMVIYTYNHFSFLQNLFLTNCMVIYICIWVRLVLINLNYTRVLPRSALERTTEYWPWDWPQCDPRKCSQWPHHQHQHSGCEPLPAQRQEWRWEDLGNDVATFISTHKLVKKIK